MDHIGVRRALVELRLLGIIERSIEKESLFPWWP